MDYNITYFKSLFVSFGFNISNVKGFDSNRYFVADNEFFSIFCIYYKSCFSFPPELSAVTFLSSDKEKVEKMALELDFPDIYNTGYFIKKGVKIIKPILYNHNLSPKDIESVLPSMTKYIKKYYSFKLKLK